MDNYTEWQSPETIQQILNCKRVAVVGLSSNHLRPSNFVGYYLSRNGYEVIPVNPREDEVFGLKSYPSISDIPDPVDVVDVFRDPSAVPEIAADAVAANAKYLWLQFGVISPEGVAIAERGGIEVIMDRCIKIEHARYMGRMHWLGFNTERISAVREAL
jgi:predicted CoA-binding protein